MDIFTPILVIATIANFIASSAKILETFRNPTIKTSTIANDAKFTLLGAHLSVLIILLMFISSGAGKRPELLFAPVFVPILVFSALVIAGKTSKSLLETGYFTFSVFLFAVPAFQAANNTLAMQTALFGPVIVMLAVILTSWLVEGHLKRKYPSLCKEPIIEEIRGKKFPFPREEATAYQLLFMIYFAILSIVLQILI
jgi:hypothetical protein